MKICNSYHHLHYRLKISNAFASTIKQGYNLLTPALSATQWIGHFVKIIKVIMKLANPDISPNAVTPFSFSDSGNRLCAGFFWKCRASAESVVHVQDAIWMWTSRSVGSTLNYLH